MPTVRSLRSRLFVSYVAIILVCLLVAGLALLAALRIRQTQQRVVLQRLNDLAQIAVGALRARDSGPEEATHLLKHLDEARKVRVLMLDAWGSIFFDSQEVWEGQSFLERARVKRDIEGNLQGTFRDAEGQVWLFVARSTVAGSRSRMLVFATLQPRGGSAGLGAGQSFDPVGMGWVWSSPRRSSRLIGAPSPPRAWLG